MRSSPWPNWQAGRIAQAVIVIVATGMMCLTRAEAKPEDYRLGAGDLIRIKVFDHEELSVDARISQTGNITFPLDRAIAHSRIVDPGNRIASGAILD